MNTPAPISDHDFEAIAEAVMETERGRWFLNEFARRNRAADTAMVLTALEEIERRLAARAPAESETATELLRHVAARAALLRECLESDPLETRAARALRHLDRLESLLALASPKEEESLALAPLPPTAESPPLVEITAPSLAAVEAEPAPDPEPIVARTPVPPLPEPEPVRHTEPAPVFAEAPRSVFAATPAVEPVVTPSRNDAVRTWEAAATPVAAKTEARRAPPKVDPEEPRPTASFGPDLLGSLSAAERAMLFA